jgi:hypothetical protein
MGLRSPQEMQQVQAAPERSTRMAGSPAPQLDTKFLSTLSEANQLRERNRLAQEEKNLKFAKALAGVEAEKAYLEATSKLATKKGADAFPEASRLREELRQKVSKVVSGVDPRYQEEVFKQLAPEIESRYNRTAIPYQYAQAQNLREGIFKERVAAVSRDVIQSGSDPEYLDKEGIAKLYQAVIDYGESQYGDLDAVTPEGFTAREAIQQMAQTTVSKSLAEAAIGQAQLGSISRSEEILSKFSKEITEPDRLKVIKAIEKAKADGTNGAAMQIARLAINEYGDDIVSIQKSIEAQSSGNMDLYKTAMAFVTSVKGAEKKAKELRREKGMAQAVQAIENGQFNDQVINALEDPEDRIKARQYAVDFAAGKMTITDKKVFDKLMSVVMDDPAKLASGEINLQAYKPYLNKEDFKMFEGIAIQMSKDKSKEAMRVANRGYRLASDVITNYLNSKGIMDAIRVGQARNFAMNYVTDLMEKNPKISEADLRLKLQQALYDRGTKIEKKGGIFGFFQKETETPAEIGVRIKPDIRERILKRKGNLTESQLLEVAKKLQEQNPNLDIFE